MKKTSDARLTFTGRDNHPQETGANYKNICYRCGKERVVSKVWKEKVGYSVVENTESVCPDKKCQRELNQDIARQRKRRLKLEEKHKRSAIKPKIKVKKNNK